MSKCQNVKPRPPKAKKMSKCQAPSPNIILILIMLSFIIPSSARAKNCLWKVQSDKNTVYLMGSIHLYKKENYPLSRPIEKAFSNSSVIVFETEMDKMQSPKAQEMLLEIGLMTEGKTVKDHLDTETYELLSDEIKKMGLNIKMFKKFQPWFLAITLTVLKIQSMGYNPADGIDLYFYQKAVIDKKETTGLETLEEQFAHLNTLAGLNQNDLIRQYIADISNLEKECIDIMNAWSSGDTDKLKIIILKNFEKYPEIYNELLIKRNKKWMSKIVPFLKTDKNYIIIVGAGHLVGKGSLIELLKKKGYSVEQL